VSRPFGARTFDRIVDASIFHSGLTAQLAEVHAGHLYRSATLGARELGHVIDTYDIRTIVNLRDAKPGRYWHETEKRVARERGVRLIDIRMSSRHLPHKHALRELLDTFETAERPMLVHCRFGSERTGIACAMYRIDYLGVANEAASREMLCARYGHLPAFAPAARCFVERVHRGAEWARESYDPCVQDYLYYDRAQLCAV